MITRRAFFESALLAGGAALFDPAPGVEALEGGASGEAGERPDALCIPGGLVWRLMLRRFAG